MTAADAMISVGVDFAAWEKTHISSLPQTARADSRATIDAPCAMRRFVQILLIVAK